jgi:hypothetical protein
VRLTAAAVLGVVIFTPVPAHGDTNDRFAKTLPLAAGRPIRVEATIADVTIVGSDRSDLAVEIVRRAPSAADLPKYPVVVEDGPDALRIAVTQSDDGRDASLRTDISIAGPADAVYQAIRVFEGHVRLTNVKGGCDVDLRRGAIDAASIAGRVRLESGIGSVSVRQAELTRGGMMRLRVFNGPLRVRFARPPASGRILAVTFNGSITSDIPLTMKDKFGPRFGETTIGDGDPVMSVDVVKGDITIAVDGKR